VPLNGAGHDRPAAPKKSTRTPRVPA